MKHVITTYQIGKQGLTPQVIQDLDRRFQFHKHIRISVLSASGRNRDSIKILAQKLVEQLKYPCQCKIIGFTIVLRKSQPANDKVLKKSKPNKE